MLPYGIMEHLQGILVHIGTAPFPIIGILVKKKGMHPSPTAFRPSPDSCFVLIAEGSRSRHSLLITCACDCSGLPEIINIFIAHCSARTSSSDSGQKLTWMHAQAPQHNSSQKHIHHRNASCDKVEHCPAIHPTGQTSPHVVAVTQFWHDLHHFLQVRPEKRC